MLGEQINLLRWMHLQGRLICPSSSMTFDHGRKWKKKSCGTVSVEARQCADEVEVAPVGECGSHVGQTP